MNTNVSKNVYIFKVVLESQVKMRLFNSIFKSTQCNQYMSWWKLMATAFDVNDDKNIIMSTL